MVYAVAYEDAKANQVRSEGDGKGVSGKVLHTPFLGSRNKPALPFAQLVEYDGRLSNPHFHAVDQFQVVIAGKGTLGRHDLAPYSVHFARAFTPYGPLSDNGSGLTFFVIRAHPDPGPQFLSKAAEKLKLVHDRKPLQMTRRVHFPLELQQAIAQDAVVEPVPDMNDDRGLAACAMTLKPNGTAFAPDPSRGDGQFLIGVEGSFLHSDKEYQALALLFVSPQEGPYRLRAGPNGLKVLVLNFPLPRIGEAGGATNNQSPSGVVH